MATKVVMPQLGQAMVTGLVAAWHVEDGQAARAGSPLLTIESDKSAFDIDAPATGIVRHAVPAGAEVEVGAVLGSIGAEAEASGEPSAAAAPEAAPAARSAAAPKEPAFVSPRARALAAGRIDLADIAPRRADGLITAADIESHMASKGAGQPLGGARLGAIRRLQASWSQAPHIVQFVEVDATRLLEARALIRHGRLNATLNDLMIQAAAETMSVFQDLNGSIEGDVFMPNDDVSVSLAVETDRGLRTPVVKWAQGLGLEDLAARTRDAITAAQQGRASAQRASLTISNLGRFGIRAGTPVLNMDEAVLVFVGAIEERPCVSEGAVSVRGGLTLSIAFDHRIADGMRAAQFSDELRRRLERLDLSKWQGEVDPMPTERSVQLVSSGGFRCRLTSGMHCWTIDEPASLGGSDHGPDPVASLLGSLLSCLTIAFKATAARRKVAIDRISGEIAANPHGKVTEINVRLDVWSSAPRAEIEKLLKPAKAACHVHAMLREDLAVAVEVVASPTVGEEG